ncbi:hypothetical protein [Vibrio sp. M260118]|uniref:hypothetical protein n=1 Tax=Vibrio sp. M260118 TaxID=3020896 RepID=UPI002F4163C3
MNVIPHIITTKAFADDIYSILQEHNATYTRLDTFSSFQASDIFLILNELPWEFLAGIIAGYIGHKNTKVEASTKRRVMIKYPDNSEIDATNIPPEELKELIHPHKQIYISMFEENERS